MYINYTKTKVHKQAENLSIKISTERRDAASTRQKQTNIQIIETHTNRGIQKYSIRIHIRHHNPSLSNL